MKSVVLVSGGIDSTVLLFDLIEQTKEQLIPIFIDYNQKQMIAELESVKKVVSFVKQNHSDKIKDLIIISNPQIIPATEYIPFRNLNLISACLSTFSTSDEILINLGIIKAHSNFTDCTPEYFETLNQLIKFEYPKCEINTPYISHNKGDVAAIASKLKVPANLSFCCNKSDQFHCNQCSSCKDRMVFFRELNKLSQNPN